MCSSESSIITETLLTEIFNRNCASINNEQVDALSQNGYGRCKFTMKHINHILTVMIQLYVILYILAFCLRNDINSYIFIFNISKYYLLSQNTKIILIIIQLVIYFNNFFNNYII
jgi:hypothetical protein